MQNKQLPIMVPVAVTDRLPNHPWDLCLVTKVTAGIAFPHGRYIGGKWISVVDGEEITDSVTHWYEPVPHTDVQASAIAHAIQFLDNEFHMVDAAQTEADEIWHKLKTLFPSL